MTFAGGLWLKLKKNICQENSVSFAECKIPFGEMQDSKNYSTGSLNFRKALTQYRQAEEFAYTLHTPVF